MVDSIKEVSIKFPTGKKHGEAINFMGTVPTVAIRGRDICVKKTEDAIKVTVVF